MEATCKTIIWIKRTTIQEHDGRNDENTYYAETTKDKV